MVLIDLVLLIQSSESWVVSFCIHLFIHKNENLRLFEGVDYGEPSSEPPLCHYGLIITITISSNVTGALADLFFTYHVQLWTDSWPLSDTCNGRVEAYNYTKSTRLDPPITELIKITIAGEFQK